MGAAGEIFRPFEQSHLGRSHHLTSDWMDKCPSRAEGDSYLWLRSESLFGDIRKEAFGA